MKDEEQADQIPAEELLSAHPVEPAEGAREPGRNADETRPPHPVEPAEGPRQPMVKRTDGDTASASDSDNNDG